MSETPKENPNCVYDAIKSVWDEHSNEEYRKDQSHYRGVGRWIDDQAWRAIGAGSLQKVQKLWHFANRPQTGLKDLNTLEWGPGGGANLYGLRDISALYYGVDISAKNLGEAQRMIAAEARPNLFSPVLLEDTPYTIQRSIIADVDLFLSTAVFQHFPSKDYGKDVLKAIRSVCSPRALGFIQIRFDNGNEKYSSLTSLDEYKEKHITATSYRLDEFWQMISDCGFNPLFIDSIYIRNNYATYYLSVR